MKIIGLTGGIGSGKSTVAKMFQDLGIPIYNADREAKNLMNTSLALKSSIKALFGEDAYEKGELNRAYVAEIVFKDKQRLEALNQLVHPRVKEDFSRWVALQNAPYVIQENPLIFEKGQQDLFDLVITVTAKKEVRIKRVMDRDGLSEVQVQERMRNQLDDNYKIENSDFVIVNQTLENTRVQVKKIHQQLLQ